MAFSGDSDELIGFPTPISDARILTANASGDGNFVIQTIDGRGREADLLVNTIGAYSGSVLMLPRGTISGLQITANSPWTIKVQDVTTGPQWNGTTRVAGKGDSVLIIPGGTSASETVKISNSGQGNFVVYETDSSRKLLVNKAGSWSGTEPLPSDTVLVEVLSAGAWSITPTS
jgi:hypothetical protein